MPEYRAFLLDRDDHFMGYEALVCPDDAGAVEKAKRLVNGHGVEVWTGSRLVAKLTAAMGKSGALAP